MDAQLEIFVKLEVLLRFPSSVFIRMCFFLSMEDSPRDDHIDESQKWSNGATP